MGCLGNPRALRLGGFVGILDAATAHVSPSTRALEFLQGCH